MLRFGYNTLSVQDPEAYLCHLHQLQPRAVLFYSNQLDYARRAKAELPNTEVILRNWPDHDFHFRQTPLEWVNWYEPAAAGGLMLYTTNEPGFSQRLLDWTYEVMLIAAQRRLKLCVLNLSVGTPSPDDWSKFNRILKLAAEHRDLFVIGLHEYAAGIITSGLIGGTPNTHGFIDPQFWPTNTEILARWHCGRYAFLVNHCRSIGLEVPRLMITEFGWDFLGDLSEWIKQQPREGSELPDGWRTWVKAWQSWWPKWSSGDALFNQLEYADKELYGPEVEALLLFAYGSDGNWDDYRVDGVLEPFLEAYATRSSYPPVTSTPRLQEKPTPQDPRWSAPHLVIAPNGAWLRDDATTQSHKLALLSTGDIVRYINLPGDWHAIWAANQVGFTNKAVVRFEAANTLMINLPEGSTDGQAYAISLLEQLVAAMKARG